MKPQFRKCNLDTSSTRTVQKTRRPAQPAATRSEDSGGRTRVPAKLTRPLTGRLSVFGFQTRNTRPEPIVYAYRRSITIFRPDLARSSRYPTKSRPDLDGSGHISARYRRIRSDFVPGDKPETDETRTEKSNQISGSVSGQFFLHPSHSGRVRIGHKPDPWTPLSSTYLLNTLCIYSIDFE